MRLPLLSLLLLLASSGAALACTCAPLVLERDLPRADAAFVGTVLERRADGGEATLLFRVEQIYRGELESRVEVVTAPDGAACGLEADVGDRLGLLLERDGASWRSGLCSQVEPGAFLELTDVDDNTLPAINWGGYLVGTLVLAAGAFFLGRRLRRERRVP
jgi:hypothetical protein